MKHLRIAVMSLVTMFAAHQGAVAQSGDYPSRAVTIMTPFAPGNGPDVLVRALAQELSRQTGQSFVVESKPGAATLVAAQSAAKATADGYTIFISAHETFGANRHVFKKPPYDPVKDFQVLTSLAKGSLVLLVNNKVPAKSVEELVALAKQSPGKITYGHANLVTRGIAEAFAQSAGIQLTGVPYKSTTQAMPDLIGGQIDMLFTDLTQLRMVKEGKLRALAVTDSRRSAFAPELPTLTELRVKDGEASFMIQVAVPAGTPKVTAQRIHALVSKAARHPQLEQIYANNGMYPYLTTPEETAAINDAEAARAAAFMKKFGIEPQ